MEIHFLTIRSMMAAGIRAAWNFPFLPRVVNWRVYSLPSSGSKQVKSPGQEAGVDVRASRVGGYTGQGWMGISARLEAGGV